MAKRKQNVKKRQDKEEAQMIAEAMPQAYKNVQAVTQESVKAQK